MAEARPYRHLPSSDLPKNQSILLRQAELRAYEQQTNETVSGFEVMHRMATAEPSGPLTLTDEQLEAEVAAQYFGGELVRISGGRLSAESTEDAAQLVAEAQLSARGQGRGQQGLHPMNPAKVSGNGSAAGGESFKQSELRYQNAGSAAMATAVRAGANVQDTMLSRVRQPSLHAGSPAALASPTAASPRAASPRAAAVSQPASTGPADAAEISFLMRQLEDSLAVASDLEGQARALTLQREELQAQLRMEKEEREGMARSTLAHETQTKRAVTAAAATGAGDTADDDPASILPLLHADVRALALAARQMQDNGEEGSEAAAAIEESLEQRLALLTRFEGLLRLQEALAGAEGEAAGEETAQAREEGEEDTAALEVELQERLAELHSLQAQAAELMQVREQYAMAIAEAEGEGERGTPIPPSFASMPESEQQAAIAARLDLLRQFLELPGFDTLVVQALLSVMGALCGTGGGSETDADVAGDSLNRELQALHAAATSLAVPRGEGPAYVSGEAVVALMRLCLREAIWAALTGEDGSAVLSGLTSGEDSDEGIMANLSAVTTSPVFANTFRLCVVQRLLGPFPTAAGLVGDQMAGQGKEQERNAGSAAAPSSATGAPRPMPPPVSVHTQPVAGKKPASPPYPHARTVRSSTTVAATARAGDGAREFHVWGPGRSVALSSRFKDSEALQAEARAKREAATAAASEKILARLGVRMPLSSSLPTANTLQALAHRYDAGHLDSSIRMGAREAGEAIDCGALPAPPPPRLPGSVPVKAQGRVKGKRRSTGSALFRPAVSTALVLSLPAASPRGRKVTLAQPPPVGANAKHALSRLRKYAADVGKLDVERSTYAHRSHARAVHAEPSPNPVEHRVKTRQEYKEEGGECSSPIGYGRTSPVADLTVLPVSHSRAISPAKVKHSFGVALPPERSAGAMARHTIIHDTLHQKTISARGFMPGHVADNFPAPKGRAASVILCMTRPPPPPPDWWLQSFRTGPPAAEREGALPLTAGGMIHAIRHNLDASAARRPLPYMPSPSLVQAAGLDAIGRSLGMRLTGSGVASSYDAGSLSSPVGMADSLGPLGLRSWGGLQDGPLMSPQSLLPTPPVSPQRHGGGYRWRGGSVSPGMEALVGGDGLAPIAPAPHPGSLPLHDVYMDGPHSPGRFGEYLDRVGTAADAAVAKIAAESGGAPPLPRPNSPLSRPVHSVPTRARVPSPSQARAAADALAQTRAAECEEAMRPHMMMAGAQMAVAHELGAAMHRHSAVSDTVRGAGSALRGGLSARTPLTISVAAGGAALGISPVRDPSGRGDARDSSTTFPMPAGPEASGLGWSYRDRAETSPLQCRAASPASPSPALLMVSRRREGESAGLRRPEAIGRAGVVSAASQESEYEYDAEEWGEERTGLPAPLVLPTLGMSSLPTPTPLPSVEMLVTPMPVVGTAALDVLANQKLDEATWAISRARQRISSASARNDVASRKNSRSSSSGLAQGYADDSETEEEARASQRSARNLSLPLAFYDSVPVALPVQQVSGTPSPSDPALSGGRPKTSRLIPHPSPDQYADYVRSPNTSTGHPTTSPQARPAVGPGGFFDFAQDALDLSRLSRAGDLEEDVEGEETVWTSQPPVSRVCPPYQGADDAPVGGVASLEEEEDGGEGEALALDSEDEQNLLAFRAAAASLLATYEEAEDAGAARKFLGGAAALQGGFGSGFPAALRAAFPPMPIGLLPLTRSGVGDVTTEEDVDAGAYEDIREDDEGEEGEDDEDEDEDEDEERILASFKTRPIAPVLGRVLEDDEEEEDEDEVEERMNCGPSGADAALNDSFHALMEEASASVLQQKRVIADVLRVLGREGEGKASDQPAHTNWAPLLLRTKAAALSVALKTLATWQGTSQTDSVLRLSDGDLNLLCTGVSNALTTCPSPAPPGLSTFLHRMIATTSSSLRAACLYHVGKDRTAADTQWEVMAGVRQALGDWLEVASGSLPGTWAEDQGAEEEEEQDAVPAVRIALHPPALPAGLPRGSVSQGDMINAHMLAAAARHWPGNARQADDD